jgi:hypothetical protein
MSDLIKTQRSFATKAMHQPTDLPPCFEQENPYSPLESLALYGKEGMEVSAYILRKLLGGGNGVPNASRIAF